MQRTIAIDGACRLNGTPNCVSTGAAFIIDLDEETGIEQGYLDTLWEANSTSQRGELQGLYIALDYICAHPEDTVIITDSEYIFNTMTKEWVNRWVHNGWKTAQGTEVKNADIWQAIWKLYKLCKDNITFFHIKGHLLSVGAKTRSILLGKDTTGYCLYDKVKQGKDIAPEKAEHAKELSIKNNGFSVNEDTLRSFAAMNLVADAAANWTVDKVLENAWLSVIDSGLPTA